MQLREFCEISCIDECLLSLFYHLYQHGNHRYLLGGSSLVLLQYFYYSGQWELWPWLLCPSEILPSRWLFVMFCFAFLYFQNHKTLQAHLTYLPPPHPSTSRGVLALSYLCSPFSFDIESLVWAQRPQTCGSCASASQVAGITSRHRCVWHLMHFSSQTLSLHLPKEPGSFH